MWLNYPLTNIRLRPHSQSSFQATYLWARHLCVADDSVLRLIMLALVRRCAGEERTV